MLKSYVDVAKKSSRALRIGEPTLKRKLEMISDQKFNEEPVGRQCARRLKFLFRFTQDC